VLLLDYAGFPIWQTLRELKVKKKTKEQEIFALFILFESVIKLQIKSPEKGKKLKEE